MTILNPNFNGSRAADASLSTNVLDYDDGSPLSVLQYAQATVVKIENDPQCAKIRGDMASSILMSILTQLADISDRDRLVGRYVSETVASVVSEAAMLHISAIGELLACDVRQS